LSSCLPVKTFQILWPIVAEIFVPMMDVASPWGSPVARFPYLLVKRLDPLLDPLTARLVSTGGGPHLGRVGIAPVTYATELDRLDSDTPALSGFDKRGPP